MSCKVVRIKNCEVEGTSFESRTVTLNGGIITSAKIVVRTNLNKHLQEVPGVIEDNIIHFSLKPLEGLSAGNYIIEYWVEIENIGREVVVVEDFKVVRAMDGSCNCESQTEITANLVFNKKEITVNLTKNIINSSSDKVRRMVINEDIIVTNEAQELKGWNFDMKKGKVYRVKYGAITSGGIGSYGGLYSGNINSEITIASLFGRSLNVSPTNNYNQWLMAANEPYIMEGVFVPDNNMKVQMIFQLYPGQTNGEVITIKKGTFLEIEEMA